MIILWTSYKFLLYQDLFFKHKPVTEVSLKFLNSTRITCGFLIIYGLSMKTETCLKSVILMVNNIFHTIFIL